MNRDEMRDEIAALFRNPPDQERLGDQTPREIADAVMDIVTDEALDRMANKLLDVAADLEPAPARKPIRTRAERLLDRLGPKPGERPT